MKSTMSSKLSYALLFTGFGLLIFFSSFHLFNSPETWLDEGLIIQSAVGLLHTGKAALPVAPGVYEPAWYITTGFPLTIPLAGTFAVFGVSLEAARLVMLVFLICFYIALFLYARGAIGGRTAWFGFFLLVFFGPIYGDGRNVLGEIPGLLCMLLALMPLMRGGELTRTRALLAGVGAGLAFAAKPIFILFLPALLLACVVRHKELKLKKVFLWGVLGVLIPAVLWVFTQFDNAAFLQVLAVYANPHDVNVGSAIAANVKSLFTEMQPLYFLVALALWVASYAVRRFRRETVRITEEVLLFFSILVLFAYLRNAGYYRYFFVAQVFAVLYLPQSMLYLAGSYGRLASRAAIVCLCGLVLFQAYETAFRSWAAVHYDSMRTASLERYFAGLPAGEEIFVYQAPEVMTFVGTHPAYQFVQITPSLTAGSAYASLVLTGEMPRVITPVEFFSAHTDDIFPRYTVGEALDNYVILVPKAARQ
jgi:hypothetical protein